eukprot:3938029-Rhodomonas_salina.9
MMVPGGVFPYNLAGILAWYRHTLGQYRKSRSTGVGRWGDATRSAGADEERDEVLQLCQYRAQLCRAMPVLNTQYARSSIGDRIGNA